MEKKKKVKKEVIHFRVYNLADDTIYNHACGKGEIAGDEVSCCTTDVDKVTCKACLKEIK